MESPTKASTVNGTLQKTAKHQDMRLETGVEGNGYDRAETIEDIISELNATAKKDAPLSEAPADVMLHGDGQQSIDSEDRCDPTTDSKASSSGNVDGGKRDSTPASTREEAKSAAVSTDVSVSAEGENIVASHASEIDSEDARKVENASNGDSDQPLEGEKASECLNTLETDAKEQSVNECNDKETTKAVPDLTEADDGSNEVITSDIKVPDEAVMSPRRTARQRTNSTKRGKPTDTKRAQNLANKAKRKAVREEHPLSSTLVNHSTHEDREESCGVSKPKKAKDEAGSSTEGVLDSSGAASAMVGKKKRLVKSKELKNDSSIGLNVGDIGGSGDTRADEKGSSFPEQNSFAQSAGAVSSWSSSHFKASDHHLQKSIQLSLKDWAPSARPSYLTIEVPSVNARRMWGPGFSRQRPTVVFGGCDPLNTYVNVDGVRVLLLQWQKVSNIIPTIRLTDIFQCFKHM
ncbi:hypothetical protein HPB49_018527 [Dermacentor silvarum]|uniref:Uncharacterized protein n=1 Tax=Dermacentor silvarum TaxID=543639 RepID=A0ACB8D7C3_DERSI|nr:hypothetical protein HPB49_018527 [Dermacentor silvarum]